MKTIALDDLDEGVRRLLEGLPEGEVLTVLDGRKSIATIARGSGLDLKPKDMSDEERQRRHLAFVDMLAKQPVRNLGKFNRDELYEDDKW